MTNPHIKRITTRDDYCTPDALFYKLNKLWKFDFDLAADSQNTKCKNFFSEANSAEQFDHANAACFCNPPFSNKEMFFDIALKYRNQNNTFVFLVPNNAREASWWKKYVWNQADQIITLSPRVNYFLDGEQKGSCAFGSCLVIYYPRLRGLGLATIETIWNWKDKP